MSATSRPPAGVCSDASRKHSGRYEPSTEIRSKPPGGSSRIFSARARPASGKTLALAVRREMVLVPRGIVLPCPHFAAAAFKPEGGHATTPLEHPDVRCDWRPEAPHCREREPGPPEPDPCGLARYIRCHGRGTIRRAANRAQSILSLWGVETRLPQFWVQPEPWSPAHRCQPAQASTFLAAAATTSSVPSGGPPSSA